MDIIQVIKRNIAQSGATPDSKFGVALSGGADSTALLTAMTRLGLQVEALHCNFELRGRESDRDEAACRRLCRELGVGLTVKHFRTRATAQRRGISVEMAARELRYEWFAAMAREHNLHAICVAHHRDDNVETMLLNLIRGTGLHGLTGMRAASRRDDGLLILRPMLEVPRSAIEEWLTEQGMTWQTDSTNLDADAAQRNAIRHELLPQMERLNPAVRQTLAATAERLAQAEALYDDALAHARSQVVSSDSRYTSININALRQTAAPQTVLYELLAPSGFNSSQTADIMAHLDGEPGHVWQSRTGARLLRDRQRLLLETADDDVASKATGQAVLPLEGTLQWGGIKMNIRRQPVDVAFAIPRESSVACFDLHKLTLPLTMRYVREGDRFRPFGMEGTRLVSDLLTDAKVPLFERRRQLVVLSGDEIIWVVGRRVAAGYEITAETRHAMILICQST